MSGSVFLNYKTGNCAYFNKPAACQRFFRTPVYNIMLIPIGQSCISGTIPLLLNNCRTAMRDRP